MDRGNRKGEILSRKEQTVVHQRKKLMEMLLGGKNPSSLIKSNIHKKHIVFFRDFHRSIHRACLSRYQSLTVLPSETKLVKAKIETLFAFFQIEFKNGIVNRLSDRI